MPLTHRSHDSEILSYGVPRREGFLEMANEQKIDQDGRLLGLSRRLVTENITSKLSEKFVTAFRDINRRIRTTYELIFREGSRRLEKTVTQI